MLSGIQEILVILVILLAIIVIPRRMSPQRKKTSKNTRYPGNIRNISVPWRFAIVITLLWLLGSAAYFKPWQGTMESFLLLGCGPIIIGWCVTWVVAGLRPGRKN